MIADRDDRRGPRRDDVPEREHARSIIPALMVCRAVRHRDRRQGAHLLSLRHRDDRAARHAAEGGAGRPPSRGPVRPGAARARRRRACSWDRCSPGVPREVGYALAGGRWRLVWQLWLAPVVARGGCWLRLRSAIIWSLSLLTSGLHPYVRRSPRGHRRARPARRPHRQAGVHDRPPQRERPAAGRQRRLARPRRDRARRRPVHPARPRLALRHLRQRRGSHRARS